MYIYAKTNVMANLRMYAAFSRKHKTHQDYLIGYKKKQHDICVDTNSILDGIQITASN